MGSVVWVGLTFGLLLFEIRGFSETDIFSFEDLKQFRMALASLKLPDRKRHSLEWPECHGHARTGS